MEIRSDDPRLRLEATRGFRKILSVEKNPPVNQVLQSQCLPILVQFLACQDTPELQFEAAWALTNIASTDFTKVSQNRRKENDSLASNSKQCLLSRFPTRNGPYCKASNLDVSIGCGLWEQVVVEFGATPYLVALLTSPSADVREQCAWCLGNIAGDCPELRDIVLRADVSHKPDTSRRRSLII